MNTLIRRAAAVLAAVLLLQTGAAACSSDRRASSSLSGIYVSLSVPASSPQRPTVTARVRFANLDESFSRLCTVVWYQDGIPVRTDRDFLLTAGAVAACSFTTIFSAGSPAYSVISCRITSGKESLYAETQMELKNYGKLYYARLKASPSPYRIDVLRNQNVVLIYALDENGQYTVLQNAFLCSTGPGTPSGSFRISEKFRWRALFRTAKVHYPYVYGQYATRITGDILFHSVPYETQNPGDLKADEFNKLGTEASLGCVRLMVAGVKWIYDNCPAGTPVQVYDVDRLYITRPVAPVIDTTDTCCGWDPTDPDAANPW